MHGGPAASVASMVGREDEVHLARTLLGSTPARHLRVTAGPAMGSSWFARLVAAETGRPVLTVRADRASSAIPMGAVAPLVSAPGDSLGSGPDVLVRAVARLVPPVATPPVVVVDAAQHLDDVSALVLAQAADAGATLVMTTARNGRLPSALAALWRTAPVGELALRPLDDSAVAQLAARVLAAPADPGLVRALTRLVGGASAAIVDAVEHARRDERIVHAGSSWRLLAALELAPLTLARADAVLDLLTGDERTVVDLLSLTGAVPRTALLAVVPADALDSVKTHGLLEPGDDDQVRLADPLVQAASLHRLPEGRKRNLARALRASLADGHRASVLLDAALALHAGDTLDPGSLLQAARAALHGGQPELAASLCRHGLSPDGPAGLAILLGEVLTVLGRSHEAERLLSQVSPTSTDEHALLAQTRAVNLAYHLDAVDAALDVLSRSSRDLPGGAWSQELLGLQAVIMTMRGRPQDALGTVEPFLRTGNGRPFCQAATAAGPALVVLGRSLDAADLASRSYQERVRLGEQPLLASPELHALVRSFGLAEAGRFSEADAIASEVMAGALRHDDRQGQMWAGIMHGRSLLDQGRVDEARSTFEAAATAALDVGLVPHLAWARGGALLAAAQTGDVASTRHALLALEVAPPTRLAMMAPDLLRARGWAAVVHGELGRAASMLLEAADVAAANGERGLEVLALYDLVRLGLVDQVPRLVAVAADVQGELTAARGQHASALAASDGAALFAVSQHLERLGALVLAAEAATHAAWTFRRAQEGRQADLMHDRVARLRALRPAASTPGLALQPGAAYLTTREREVAALAGTGLPSKHIAARLDISVRTVDNLLQRVYRKLGVSSRADLRPDGLGPTTLPASPTGVPGPRTAAEQPIRPAARVRRR